MRQKYEDLTKIYTDLKSKIKFRSSTRILRQQTANANKLIAQITRLAEIENTLENQLILDKSIEIFKAIEQLAEQKSKTEVISFKATATAIIFSKALEKSVKMAQLVEIIKTIPILVPQYNGEGEKLNSTIAALNACKSLIKEENRAIAIQVILSRLEGKARSAVGDNPQNVDEIIRKLKEKCTLKIAPETVVAKMNATKQNGEIGKFTDEIEKLTLELERAFISEDVPLETASRMAVKAGVKALAAGVRNNETRLLLKAGTFSTISSAVEKMTENEPASTGSNSVLHYRTQNFRQNYNPRFTNNFNRNRGMQNRQNNYRRFETLPQRQYQNSNTNYRRNDTNNFSRFPRNNQRENAPRSRVFVAQSGNPPAPQPLVVGGTPRQSQGQSLNFIQAQPDRPHHPAQGQGMAYVQRTQ